MFHSFSFFSWKISRMLLFLQLDGLRQFLIKGGSPRSPVESAKMILKSECRCRCMESESLGTESRKLLFTVAL